MSPELEQKLVEAYPEIFVDYKNENSPMYWGIQCGDGWYDLIESICWCIQSRIDIDTSLKQPTASTIKEKFGRLRISMIDTDEYTNGVFHFAELISGRICEVCGGQGKVDTDEFGVVRTRCAQHMDMD